MDAWHQFGDTVDAPLHAGLHTGGADDVDDGDDDVR